MKEQEDRCRSEHGAILHELLNIGEMMLANGAEKALDIKTSFKPLMTKEEYLKTWCNL